MRYLHKRGIMLEYMARKTPEPNPLQGSVLEQVALLDEALSAVPTPVYEPSVELAQPVAIKGPEFPTVDLAERAELLCEALGAFGLRNQRLGFDYASNTRQHDGPIWARYRGQTPKVQEGAQANSEKFLKDAKRAFWKATGTTAMRGKGFGSDEELDAGGRKMWRDFTSKYEHTSKKPQRDKYIKRLKRTIKRINKAESAAA